MSVRLSKRTFQNYKSMYIHASMGKCIQVHVRALCVFQVSTRATQLESGHLELGQTAEIIEAKVNPNRMSHTANWYARRLQEK